MNRATWSSALVNGLTALVAVLAIEMIAALAWLQGTEEAGLDAPIDSALRMFPGSSVRYAVDGNAFFIGWTPGWLCLAAGGLVFLIGLANAGRRNPVSR